MSACTIARFPVTMIGAVLEVEEIVVRHELLKELCGLRLVARPVAAGQSLLGQMHDDSGSSSSK